MSKYASLPDIDTGADVFETPDVPEEHTYSRDDDSDDDYLPRSSSPTATRRTAPGHVAAGPSSENIDAERLDAAEARRRFGAASAAAARRSDGASKLPSRRLPSAREYVTGADPDERDKETPLERLRRLRLEMIELEEEVRRSEPERAQKAAEEGGAARDEPAEGETGRRAKGKKREVSPAVILQQLQLLRGDLQQLSPSVEGVLEADGERQPGAVDEAEGELAQKAKASAGLLSRLRLAQDGADEPSPAQGGVTKGKGPGGELDEAKEAELEKRVAELEKLLGASEADVDETHAVPPPLLSTVSRLDHLLTLLTQPRHLDTISRRVKVLVSDLERIHDSRRKLGDSRPLNVALSGGMTLVTTSATGERAPAPSPSASASLSGGGGGGEAAAALSPDAQQKLDALFALLPRLDPLLPLAPRLLARLRSLSALHASAASFGETLAGLKGEVERLGEGEKGLREVLEGLDGSVRDNEARVKGNLEAMEKRVDEVVKRLDALSA
ncbi:uncharacterized protein JCM10292_003051 [Rhodotorula paludigena]|uniref:uncharacterized protein n=1 Tax=Rhodotorula paludigena TaxID=86838 RepID=UPI0031765316